MKTALLPRASAKNFLDRYEGLTNRLPGRSTVRAQAADVLRKRGLPTLRDEAWHYTSLAGLADAQFHTALTEAAGFNTAPRLPDLAGLEDAARLVFVQGRFSAAHSILPAHISVKSFAATADFGTLAKPEREPMVALNTMLAEDGAVIDVAAGQDGGRLLLISLGQDVGGTATAFHPRHAIRLGAGARLELFEIAQGHGTYLHNPVMEILLQEGAQLRHTRLQNDGISATHLATIYAEMGAAASYDCFTLSMGARLARTEIHAHLHGAGAVAHVNAAQILRGVQHSDFTTVMRHEAPACASRQTVKHVLAGKSRGVFQGKIQVDRLAQKTDGYQMNQALLLSPQAEIDCKPQLEIFADDVKCSHGATVGALDAAQIFYLTSRGIGKAEAEAMLVRAFLAESLDMIRDDAARMLLDRVIDAWWEQPQ